MAMVAMVIVVLQATIDLGSANPSGTYEVWSGFTDSESMDSILNYQWRKLWSEFQEPRAYEGKKTSRSKRSFTDPTSMDSILNYQWSKLWSEFQGSRDYESKKASRSKGIPF